MDTSFATVEEERAKQTTGDERSRERRCAEGAMTCWTTCTCGISSPMHGTEGFLCFLEVHRGQIIPGIVSRSKTWKFSRWFHVPDD